MRLVDQGVQRLVHQPRRLVVDAEPALLLHHLALAAERPVVDGERAHPVRLEVEHRVQRLGGEVLVVHGDVVRGVRVGAAAVRLQDLVELLRAVLRRPVEHHVLEEVADAGDAGALVARAHLEEGVEAHHRGVVVGHHPDAQPVGESGLVDGEESASVFGRRLTGRALHTAAPAPSHRLRTPSAHRGEHETAPDALRPTRARGELQEAPRAAVGRGDGGGRLDSPGGAPARRPLAQLPLERAQPVFELGDAIEQRAVLDSTGPGARVHHSRYAASGGVLPQETGLPRDTPDHRCSAATTLPLPPSSRSTAGVHTRPSLPEAVRALEEALRVLSDSELARLLDGAARMPVERSRQVFVNRNLRMGNVEMVGFDMDYTLAIYHLRRIEQLSFDLTLSRLVTDFGYPPEVGLLQYDHGFVMRGLVVDKAQGNLIKMDRFGSVGRAYHGLAPLPVERVPPAVPQRAHPADQRSLRMDRHAVLPSRGLALRGDHRPAGAAGAARWSTAGSTTTCGRPSTPSTATTR